jgi:hypothetical protein
MNSCIKRSTDASARHPYLFDSALTAVLLVAGLTWGLLEFRYLGQRQGDVLPRPAAWAAHALGDGGHRGDHHLVGLAAPGAAHGADAGCRCPSGSFNAASLRERDHRARLIVRHLQRERLRSKTIAHPARSYRHSRTDGRDGLQSRLESARHEQWAGNEYRSGGIQRALRMCVRRVMDLARYFRYLASQRGAPSRRGPHDDRATSPTRSQ